MDDDDDDGADKKKARFAVLREPAEATTWTLRGCSLLKAPVRAGVLYTSRRPEISRDRQLFNPRV
jgi:hypothetical protein